MIEFRQVCKKYENTIIIENLDLTIPTGEFLTVIGSSGSGKTTLMKMINGLVSIDSGDVLIDGKSIADEDLIELRRRIGYAIQGNILFPHLTVFENIAYVLRLKQYPQEDIERIVYEKLDMIGLSHEIATMFPNALSGGQQQRVGIARALASNPDILLMDEPFGAVDAITRYQVQNELKQLHRQLKNTIVFITHDIAEALKLGTRVMVLDEGKIQQIGTPDEIRLHPKNEFVERLIVLSGV
ncbi:ATP-binding cassette domain-containing protein [Granulicatella sp. zg-ZJ]|uniref:ATP-binding cassette domain-containing protein n=1 Tax=Granulicatella sp. zg-ZJ TaxID=2678504 RepID=UPI0013D585B6|nr:ABC transporter ATP-binding protein [Granulicatella sp. zg-ZJ]NEW61883.1 ATP-binding cassette domain-containing protein [Granulicatella sp. zg-ZJ]